MEWYYIILICFGLFLLLALPGLWMATALGMAGIIAMNLTDFSAPQVVANCVWKLSTDFALTAVPLFLVMGEIIIESRVSKRFYKAVAKYLKHIPGGLLHSNIAACGIFSAICGSSPATAAAVGGVALPELEALNYKNRYSYGTIAAGGTLGILIPPSIVLIIYGSLCNESVIKLFTAAIIPGLMLLQIFSIYVLILGIVRKKDFKIKWELYDDVSHVEAMKGILPLLIMIIVVLSCIYTGVSTPTEAAGIGSFLAIISGLFFGELTLKRFWNALKIAARTTSMLLFIVLGTSIFSYIMSSTNATAQLVSWLVDMDLSKYLLLIMVYVMYIVLGFIMEPISMIYLTLPILYPVMIGYGFNGIWFAVVLVILMEIGLLTPPLGINLLVLKGIVPHAKISEIAIGVVPYLFLMLLMIAILTFFPSIATFLI